MGYVAKLHRQFRVGTTFVCQLSCFAALFDGVLFQRSTFVYFKDNKIVLNAKCEIE